MVPSAAGEGSVGKWMPRPGGAESAVLFTDEEIFSGGGDGWGVRISAVYGFLMVGAGIIVGVSLGSRE